MNKRIDQSEILTNHLKLRKLTPSDWPAISYLRSAKEVNKYVVRPSAETKEKAQEFISKITKGVEKNTIYYWVITEKENSEMIGSICLWNISEDKKHAEVGYDLSPKHQGRGIMSEALRVVLEFGFQKLNLVLIEAYTNGENKSSTRLLEKHGFILKKNKRDEVNYQNVIYELKGII